MDRRALAVRHYNLGVTKLRDGAHMDEVEAEFRRALELDPSHADAASNLGASLLAKGMRGTALEYFARAAELRPDEPRYVANLTRNLVLLGRVEEASPLLLTLARLRPRNAGAYLLRESLLVPEITPDESYPARARERIHARLHRLLGESHPISDPLEMAASYFPLSYHGISNVEIAKALAQVYLRWLPSLAWTAPHIASW